MGSLGEIPTRTCTVCGHHSSVLEEFVKDNGSKFGRRNLCQKCAVIRNNRHNKMKDWKTDHQTKKRYGVSADVYKQRMSSQPSCEICGKTAELCYDHCHDTMEFRGVLCRGCNRSLGQLGDNEESILRVLRYLQKVR